MSVTDVRDIDSLSGANFYTSIDAGDVLADTYNLLEGVTDNYLEITRIEGDQVWAEFQVAFLRKGPVVVAAYPDTIVFTKGKIHTRVYDQE